MAQRVQVQLLDDITGEEAAETVTFGLDGVGYEIDLTSDNARRLREELMPYLSNSRKVRSRRGSPYRSTMPAQDESRRVREWAEKNGFTPSRRGRIKKSIVDAYQAANG